MKAVVMTGYGPVADNVQILDLPIPALLPQQVLIDVVAASINPIDLKIVQGALKRVQKQTLPARLGFDASGVVLATGQAVTRFQPGDEVYVRAPRQATGTFAEHIALEEELIAFKPRSLSHSEAAALPLVGLTTVQALRDRAQAQPGQHILIHAGSGGVGTFAIQYARQLGLHVTTTTSSKNAAWVKDLGADDVIAYDREAYLDRGRQFDIVYDTLGGDYTLDAFKVVKPGGVVVSIAGPPDRRFADQVEAGPLLRLAFWVMRRRVEALAAQHRASYYRFLTESSGAQLAEIAALVDSGSIKPVIDRIFHLEAIKEAFAYAETGRAKGKIIVQIK
jgi:alcohol dehydrogenase